MVRGVADGAGRPGCASVTAGHSAGRAANFFSDRPIVVPLRFMGRQVFGLFQEVAAGEMFLGERGGTRTLDPMIKSSFWPFSQAIGRSSISPSFLQASQLSLGKSSTSSGQTRTTPYI